MDYKLIVFARPPLLGKVKTRLAATLGSKKALNIYNQLLDLTLKIAKNSKFTFTVYWSEKQDNVSICQRGNDLGERMYNAFKSESKSTSSLCLIGTDTPHISTAIIEQAFKELKNSDIVFGPSKDGGYYLIGCKGIPPKSLFLNKTWSHNQVLSNALHVCRKLDLKVVLLDSLLDIDTEDDYNSWQNTNE